MYKMIFNKVLLHSQMCTVILAVYAYASIHSTHILELVTQATIIYANISVLKHRLMTLIGQLSAIIYYSYSQK